MCSITMRTLKSAAKVVKISELCKFYLKKIYQTHKFYIQKLYHSPKIRFQKYYHSRINYETKIRLLW